MIHIDSITVCVNYSDYLELTLPENSRHFRYCLVITDSKDKRTQQLCAKFDNVKLWITEIFYIDGYPFFKSGAIREAIEIMRRTYNSEWLAIWDADTLISPRTKQFFNNTLRDADKRNIYAPIEKYHVTINEVGSNLHHLGTACAGFLQIFNLQHMAENNILFPIVSQDCSEDDTRFSKLFQKVMYMPLPAYHLGPTGETDKPNVNWTGRKSPPCGFVKDDIDELLLKDAEYKITTELP